MINMCPVFVCPSACGVRLCRSNRLKMFLVRVFCEGGKWITPWLVKNPFVHETSGVTAQPAARWSDQSRLVLSCQSRSCDSRCPVIFTSSSVGMLVNDTVYKGYPSFKSSTKSAESLTWWFVNPKSMGLSLTFTVSHCLHQCWLRCHHVT